MAKVRIIFSTSSFHPLVKTLFLLTTFAIHSNFFVDCHPTISTSTENNTIRHHENSVDFTSSSKIENHQLGSGISDKINLKNSERQKEVSARTDITENPSLDLHNRTNSNGIHSTLKIPQLDSKVIPTIWDTIVNDNRNNGTSDDSGFWIHLTDKQLKMLYAGLIGAGSMLLFLITCCVCCSCCKCCFPCCRFRTYASLRT